MTRHRSFKRLVRARMEKTGESYTAARAMLLAAEEPEERDGPRLATSDEASGSGPTVDGRSGSTSSTSGARLSGHIGRSRGGSPSSRVPNRSRGPSRRSP
jgi:hypothetical protein